MNLNILYGLLYGVLCLLVLNVLSTTSYALTENEFKNVVYNYKVNVCNISEENALSIVNNLTVSNNISQYFDNDNVGFFFWTKLVSGSNYNLFFCVITKNGYTGASTSKCIYTSGGRWWLPGNAYKLVGGRMFYNGSTFTEYTGANINLSNETITLFGTELDVYNAVNSIGYPAGTWSNSISKDGPYLDAQFTYVYNPAFQNVTVQDLLAQDVQMKAITYSDIYYDNDYLCVFGDYDLLDHVYLAYYKYNRYSGQWEPYQWVSPYKNYEKEDNQIRLYFNGNYVANTIICLGFIPKTDDFYAQYAWFYLTGKNTSSAGGVIYPSSYSGDNDVQQQINDNNLQEIKDTLTDDSQVDSMLSEFTSGDASDIANRFGYSPLENPFVATIRTVVESTADVLLGSGNVTLDISFYGHQLTLESQDFVLPSNPVVTLIHLICNGFFIWGLYKYGFKLYQYINTGRIKKVIDETDSDKYYFF